ncbi:MAG: ABC transporter substrate-binding protein [Alcaligenaceae bacterium]|nr:ABC transporter substrate-binding protein [Alcaligenaceae bacterium]
MKLVKLSSISALVASAFIGTAMAQTVVNVGVSVSATGPAASLGIPEKNTVDVIPTDVNGVTVKYFVLDDATDTAQAVRNMRKLISENNIDVMVGSTVTPGSLAMVDVAAENKVPVISLAGNAVVVEPQEGAKKWAFKTPQNDFLMAQALAHAMKQANVKKLGFIGFADAYGQSWLQEVKNVLKDTDIKIVAEESYNRPDTSVTGQVLKLIAAKPDAILIGTAGTPGALPQRELKQRGFKGQLYHTHGSANSDFLRVCAKACEGLVLPVGPLLVASQLSDSNPVKAEGLSYIESYEAKFGAGSVSVFGGHMWDAGALINAAIPKAIASGAQPGSEAFRVAMRDALESSTDVKGVHGIFNTNANDHTGLDDRSRVLVKVVDGKWVYDEELNK